MDKILSKKGKKILGAAAMLVIILIALAPLSVYAKAGPLRITVNQVSTTSGDAFTYRLKPLETGDPMPLGSTVEGYTFTITGTGSAQIELSGYSRQGLYLYELFQVIGEEKPGYIYDKRVYVIEVHVDMELDVEVILRNEKGEKEEKIEFINSYKATASNPNLMPDPPVKKTVSGTPHYNTTFEFRLVAQDVSSPMPKGSNNGTKTIKIVGSGESGFGTWSYDKAGKYYYKVLEVDTGVNGYTYDKTVYTIVDSVTEEGGKLVVSRVVTNNLNKPVSAFDFINKFSEGKDGPKTGDYIDLTLNRILFAAGSVSAISATTYLIAGKKREGRKKHE